MRSLAVLALLFLLCAGSAPFPLFPQASAGPPTDKDWIITENTAISDQNIWMNWNLTVASGARLELRNVSLDLNFTYSRQGGIVVRSGASLLMDNCRLNSMGGGYSYFLAYGDLELNGTGLYDLGWFNGIGGLQLLGGTHSIKGCFLDNYQSHDLIYCDRSKLDIRDMSLDNHYGSCIAAQNAIIEVTDCRFQSNRQSILADYCTVNVTGCFFEEGYDACCEFTSSTTRVIGCDFGYTRQGAIPASGPIAGPARDLTIKDCNFSCYQNVILQTNGGYGDYSAITVYDPRESLVINDSFMGFSRGVCAYMTRSAQVRSSRFMMSSDCEGVSCYGQDDSDYFIEGNRFQDGQAIHVSQGAARIENNNITLGSSGYYYNTPMIEAAGPVKVIQNRMLASYNYYYPEGIALDNFMYSAGHTAEIYGNRIEGVYYGIYMSTSENVFIHDNVIINGTTGIVGNSPFDIRNNSISRCVIAMDLHNYLDASITGNSISESERGIDIQPRAPLNISGNNISANITGIRVMGPSDHIALNITIDDNNVSANGTGIQILDLNGNVRNSSVRGNAVSDCDRGIELNRSRIDVRGSRLENISEWGVYAIDSYGDLNESVERFNSSEPNACRVVRLWSLTLDVKYNVNNPGDPGHWDSIYSFNLKVRDGRGITVRDRLTYYYESVALKEYRVEADGTRLDCNPYTVIAWMAKQGVGRAHLSMNDTKHIELRLENGPDLVPLSVNLSDDSPFEGELIFFCATVLNDGTYNVHELSVRDAELRLVLDYDNLLANLPIGYFSNGTTQSISTAWVATRGWHNISIVAVAPSNMTDVMPENNYLTRSFFVAGLPVARLVINGTFFIAWEPVNFSMDVNSSDAISGYRYDFGDGQTSDWLLTPNTTHTYVAPGDFVVHGWVASSRGAVRECAEPAPIKVLFSSSAMELNATPNPTPSRQPVLFTSRIAERVGAVSLAVWQFGDGGYSYGKDPSVAEHTYAAPGNYTVTLTLNIEGGGTLVREIVMRVLNSPPKAAGKTSPEGGDVTSSFIFNSESQDPDGRIVASRWDFGDGSSSNLSRAMHSYQDHGVYNVTLTVQDDQGEWSVPAGFTVTVENLPPTVMLRADRISVEMGKAVAFDATGTSDLDDPAGALMYRWDFGDGKAAEGIKVSHSFYAPGKYDVKLTVDDGSGGLISKTVTIQVRGPATVQNAWILPAGLAAAFVLAGTAIALIVRRRGRRKGQAYRPAGNGRNSKAVRKRLLK